MGRVDEPPTYLLVDDKVGTPQGLLRQRGVCYIDVERPKDTFFSFSRSTTNLAPDENGNGPLGRIDRGGRIETKIVKSLISGQGSRPRDEGGREDERPTPRLARLDPSGPTPTARTAPSASWLSRRGGAPATAGRGRGGGAAAGIRRTKAEREADDSEPRDRPRTPAFLPNSDRLSSDIRDGTGDTSHS